MMTMALEHFQSSIASSKGLDDLRLRLYQFSSQRAISFLSSRNVWCLGGGCLHAALMQDT